MNTSLKRSNANNWAMNIADGYQTTSIIDRIKEQKKTLQNLIDFNSSFAHQNSQTSEFFIEVSMDFFIDREQNSTYLNKIDARPNSTSILIHRSNRFWSKKKKKIKMINRGGFVCYQMESSSYNLNHR